MTTTDASPPTEASNVDERLPEQHELAMPTYYLAVLLTHAS